MSLVAKTTFRSQQAASEIPSAKWAGVLFCTHHNLLSWQFLVKGVITVSHTWSCAALIPGLRTRCISRDGTCICPVQVSTPPTALSLQPLVTHSTQSTVGAPFKLLQMQQ